MTDETPGQDAEVRRDKLGRKITHAGRRGSLEPYQKLALMRDIACGDVSKTQLGTKYGMTQQGISEFAKRNKVQIDDIRLHMADQFAGLPLARKENRLAAYEREFEILMEAGNWDHHLFSMARQAALNHIAEELGQLPPRQSVTVVPVTHIVKGVDMSKLMGNPDVISTEAVIVDEE